MDPVRSQIIAGFSRVKDCAKPDELADLKGAYHWAAVVHLAEKFNEACCELEAHLIERKERAA